MIRIASLILIVIGLFGILFNRHVIKMIISFNIIELGVNIFIISVGFVNNGAALILTKDDPLNSISFVDPLPQALVLTSIVIGLGITALGLAFGRKIFRKYGTYDLSEIDRKIEAGGEDI